MATLDLYCTDSISAPATWNVGADANNGLTKTTAVISRRRLNQLMYDNRLSYDTFNIYVGRYNDAGLHAWDTSGTAIGLGNYANNCVTAGGAVSTQTIPGTFNLLPFDPAQDWHFSDIRTFGTATTNWIQCYTDSLTAPTGYRLNSGGGFTILSNVWSTATGAGDTTGAGSLLNAAFAADFTAARVLRVWKGALTNGLSCLDRWAELQESGNALDLGADETRLWTQRGFRVYDSTGAELDSATWPVGSNGTLLCNRLFVVSKTNPATAWGGITFLSGENIRGHLRITDIDGWTVSPGLKFLGGPHGDGVILDGVRDAIYEAQHYAMGYKGNTVQFRSTNSTREIQRLQVSVFGDPRIYLTKDWAVDGVSAHNLGGSDMYQFAVTSQSVDVTFRAKATDGRQNVIYDPGHAGIGNATFSGAGRMERVVIEPGVQFIGGNIQYGRAILMNGSPTTCKDWRVGGQVSGMTAGCQFMGTGIVSGLVIRNPRQMFQGAADGAASYTDRWGNTRTFSNNSTKGKVRDSQGVGLGATSASLHVGEVLITDSDIECMGAGFSWNRAGYTGNSPRITISNTVFRPSADPASLNIGVNITSATTNAPGDYVHCINNIAVGGIKCATSINATDTLINAADFGQPTTSTGAETNVGWAEYPDEGAYLQEQARAKAA